MRPTSRILSTLALMMIAVTASAVDTANFTISGSAASGAGANMVTAAGQSTLSVVQVLMGPGMYVVIAIGAVLALYGYARSQKEALWTGVVLFVLAALLKGLWAFL